MAAAKKKRSSSAGPKNFVVVADDGTAGDNELIGPFTKAAAESYVEKARVGEGFARRTAVKLTKP